VLLLATIAVAGCGHPGSASRADGTPTAAARAPHRRATTTVRPGTAWPRAKLLRRIAGRRIRVSGRVVRVDPATVTCGGIGGPVSGAAADKAWTRFRCVQPTFPAGAIAGPDASFVVEPRGPRALQVSAARLSHY
jgi:hypothetical protein